MKAAIIAVGLAICLPGVSRAGWTSLARTAPGGVALTLLLPDGTVMAASRTTDPAETPTSSGSKIWYRLTPDSSGGYANGTWTTLASSISTRLWYSSQILNDGRVFVAGGEYGTGGSLAEIYNPWDNTWTAAAAPGVFLSDSVSKVLENGTILVAPASGSATFVYNPGTNVWSSGPLPLPAGANSQNEVTWLKLSDDSILTVPRDSLTSQRYIPATNTWVADGAVPVGLYSSVGSEIGAAFLLANGDAFFIGGSSNTALYTPSGNTSPGTWRAGPSIPNVRNSSGTFVAGGAPDAGACIMPNGRVLCAFSPLMFSNAPNPGNTFPTPSSFAIYDPVANSFSSINGPTGATMNIPAYQNLMLALPNGEVLYSNFSSQLYVYTADSSPAPLAAAKPVIHQIQPNVDGSWHLTGTGLSGINEGAAYGDDAQMETNYPLVRITCGSVISYGRTLNWNSRRVNTGNTVLSTDFFLPAGMEAGGGGSCSIQVVANGVASDPQPFGGIVWVDFSFIGSFIFPENGTFFQPWNTYAEGNAAVSPGGIIRFKGPRSRLETGYFNKFTRLTASGGPVTIGN